MEQLEIWKSVKNYEGKYEVSSIGRVKSLGRTIINNGKIYQTKDRILKPSINNSGYIIVGLYKDGNGKTFGVHTLVANAFLFNKSNKPEVNHINEIKTDNRVENLEWCSRIENQNHGTINKRRKKSHLGKEKKKAWKKVSQHTLDGELIKIWDSLSSVEKTLGFANSNISNCCKGRIKHAYGYLWKYNYK